MQKIVIHLFVSDVKKEINQVEEQDMSDSTKNN